MAHIVEFRPPSSRGERRPRADAATAAEIILFPGVRYERWGDCGAAGAKRRKRDTLELGD